MRTFLALALSASLMTSTAFAGGPVLPSDQDTRVPESTVQDRNIGALPIILGVLGIAIIAASNGGGGDRRVVCITEEPETPTEPDC